MVMHVGKRRLEVMGDVLVELLILFLFDLLARSRPQCRSTVDRFFLVLFQCHHNRQIDVIGVLVDNRAQTVAIEILFLTFAQVHNFV